VHLKLDCIAEQAQWAPWVQGVVAVPESLRMRAGVAVKDAVIEVIDEHDDVGGAPVLGQADVV